MSKKYNILFFIPSPRDIKEFKQPVIDLLYGKYDVIWFKYFKELEAYERAQRFFLEYPNHYDYLCILPDDLVLNERALNILINELDNPSIPLPEFENKYPVLSGVCNLSYVNSEQQSKVAAARAVIPDPVSKKYTIFWDHFLKFDDLDKMQQDIIQCLFIGFSCQFIHRKVLQKVKFRYDNPKAPTSGIDTFFSYDASDLRIPLFIHRNARFLHLKGLGLYWRSTLSCNPDIIYTGQYKPQVVFVASTRINNDVDV